MSNLYASINADASKTEATRRGNRHISAHVRGWDTGAEVECEVLDPKTGSVTVSVYRTKGSNGAERELIARWEDAGTVELAQDLDFNLRA